MYVCVCVLGVTTVHFFALLPYCLGTVVGQEVGNYRNVQFAIEPTLALLLDLSKNKGCLVFQNMKSRENLFCTIADPIFEAWQD